MLDLLLMIVCCTLLAHVIDSRTCTSPSVQIGIRRDIQSSLIYLIILIWAILFAGLRTHYNDTITYWGLFEFSIEGEPNIAVLFESYGGFDLYQQLIKKYISTDPQVFILLSSIICCGLSLPFIIRHTNNFTASVFWFFLNDFIFLMAGIKQAIAIAIALWAIDAYINKKYIRSIVLLLIAMSFHPYIICLLCVPFLKGKAWGGKTVLWALVFAIAFVNLESLFELISAIGKDYSNSTFDNYTINPFRVVVEFVPVAISFIYRKRIRQANDTYLTLGVNMQLISFIFIFLGLFYNPIYLGRMSTYFSMLSAIMIPKMLKEAYQGNEYRKVYLVAFYCFFGLYFLLDLTKLGSISVGYDLFGHVSIFSLFS